MSRLLLALLAATAALAEIVNVKPGGKFCFLEDLVPGDPVSSKFGTKFQVFNDDSVSVSMTDPSGNVIYSGQNKKEDSFSFAAHTPGEFVICFDNSSGSTQRTVSFAIIGGTENEIVGGGIRLPINLLHY